MGAEPQVATGRERRLSGRALKEAGLGGLIVFPAEGGAVYVSVRLDAPRRGLRCLLLDERGERLSQAPVIGDGERLLARLHAPKAQRERKIQIRLEDESGAAVENVIDLRVEARPHDDPFALPRWRENAARWRGDVLEIIHTGEALGGPELHATESISGEVSFEAAADAPMVIGLWLRDLDKQDIAAGRYWLAHGPIRGVTPFRNLPPGRYAPSLVAQYIYGPERPTLRALDLGVRIQQTPRAAEAHDTYLPHWGKFRRFIHRSCKRSPDFNAFVQGLEFRLGREELMSLPRYMSFCPTGQCNALCDFCSVTINRTGIVKKQIDNGLIERFTKPVRRTVAMYGLEGNGEPTLHRQFPDLVHELTAGGSEAYLITNGSRFSEALLPAIMRLESVNVSLNAATPETHRAVMKLKEHEIVVDGLKRIVRARGFKDATLTTPADPRVSVSFVVTRQNAHEVEQFLTLAEDEIGADTALIRPLSELGNDLGTVEDLRDIVPYVSDVQDVLDAVETYKKMARRCIDIRFDGEAFKSVRPDPIGQIARPPGFENRLLAPRPNYWAVSGAGVQLSWRGANAYLRNDGAPCRWEAVSASIPTLKGETLDLRLLAAVRAGAVELIVEDAADPHDEIWRRTLTSGADGLLHEKIHVGARTGLRLRLRVAGEVEAELDFMRLRSPSAPAENAEFALRTTRWEVCSQETEADLGRGRARVRYNGAAGPYLLKSYALPAQPGARLQMALKAHVASGKLGVGLLSGDQKRWLATAEAEDGAISLEALTGQEQSVRVVLYALHDGPLDVSLDLTSATLHCEDVAEDALAAPDVLAAQDSAEAEPSIVQNTEAIAPRLIALDPPEGRKRKYFCHKPWSDLHNFTVDGRMDVCCIATGPSQERYALGNLRTQNFQDVWNGAAVKLFRRTVNTDKVLPPCARCPMGYAYQGMWFDRAYTLDKVCTAIRDSAPWPFMRLPMRTLAAIVRRTLGPLAFRRFR